MCLKVSGVHTSTELRDTLVKLYRDRLVKLQLDGVRMNADVYNAKAGLLEFLLHELEAMEFV